MHVNFKCALFGTNSNNFNNISGGKSSSFIKNANYWDALNIYAILWLIYFELSSFNFIHFKNYFPESNFAAVSNSISVQSDYKYLENVKILWRKIAVWKYFCDVKGKNLNFFSRVSSKNVQIIDFLKKVNFHKLFFM